MDTVRAGERSDALRAERSVTRRELRSSSARHRGARRPRRAAPERSLGQRLLSLAVLALCGSLLVGLSLPPTAVGAASGGAAVAQLTVTAEPVQSLAVSGLAHDAGAARDGWDVVSWAEVLRQRYGQQSYDYTVGEGPIQWPFPFPVPITDGFGYRDAPCGACSTEHMGIDFVPGAGQPISSIADGVVTLREDDNWSYGMTIEIEHAIDGQVVTSKYAHMQRGSVDLQVGDAVEVGDFIGLVGDSGVTTGPHLHFEIWIDGDKVNPFTWLKEYAAS